jgi:LPXTG-site transpeptidase (sortase) family protein
MIRLRVSPFFLFTLLTYSIVFVVFISPFITRYLLQNQTNEILAQAAPVQKTHQKVEGKPIRLIIPSRGIDLSVGNGVYNQQTQSWTLASDKALFANVSAFPNNESGGTILYGHDTPQVLQNTEHLSTNEKLIIQTENGYVFTYHFAGEEIVSPNNTAIFAYQGNPQVTLITCKGIWNQQRRQMYFHFDSVLQKS